MELDRRLAEHDANPNDAVPWSEVKALALAWMERWVFRLCFVAQPAPSLSKRRHDTKLSRKILEWNL